MENPETIFDAVWRALGKELPPQGFVISPRRDRGEIEVWDVVDSQHEIGWVLKFTSGPHVREVERR